MNVHDSIFRRHPVASYFALVYALAWAVWIPLAIVRRGATGEQVNLSLTLIAGASPGIAATLIAWAAFGRKGVIYLWQRLIRWRIRPAWYLAAFLIPALLPILTAVLVALIVGLPAGFLASVQPASLLIGLLMYIPMSLFEEVGWRGFAQPGFQARLSALGASAILGIAWSVWHLPYFLIPEFSFFPADSPAGFIAGFALYALGTIPTCILMAWLFNNSEGSLVLPCIFHGATNVFSGTFLIPLVKANGFFALALSVGLSTLTAVVVLFLFGYRRLVRGFIAPDHPAFTLIKD
jgi:membrane protease YdiL (CAAX protease family)